MHLPTRFGDPCWSSDAPERAISGIARLSQALEPYFVATHAPFGAMVDDRTNAAIDEHRLYRRLFGGDRSNVFAVVHGDPGTGKSHLIKWLHLQCEAERHRGDLPDVVPVLIQRRTGSLKDALQQLADQLPAAYERHVRPVREAVGHLGHERARHALANQLQLQLLDIANAPPELKHLNEFCGSPGTKAWLIRDGGVVDRIVRQLTQESDVADRESLPQFTAAEFELPLTARDNIASRMIDLLDELDWERERGETTLAEQAASLLNAATRPAVKAMSGFIGAGLRDVIDAVRRDLRTEHRRLAIFVEDVSVMAALDDDLLNAVEPNPDPGLAPLLAVVGMTQTGFRGLLKRENLVGRTTDLVTVGTKTLDEWREHPDALAKFVARYLNVARYDQEGVEAVAASRRDGGDVARSACERCPVREPCHEAFGSVRFEHADVGLFPFTQQSLTRLFLNLRESPNNAVRRNPRGLLEQVVKPVLRDERRTLVDGEFPRLNLAVDLDEPPFWTGFDARYLGGWSATDRARMRRFVQVWVDVTSPDDAARATEPFLEPLRFAPLSAAANPGVRDPAPTRAPARPDPTPKPVGAERPLPRAEPAELRAVLKAMREWADGAPLRDDDEPRELLFSLIKGGIDWENERLPLDAYRERAKNKSFVQFEDQRSRPKAQRVFFEVLRCEEARAVVEALARWKWQGDRSWAFADGQHHFRVAGRWLRANRQAVVRSLEPPASLDTDAAMRQAVRLLTVAALLRRDAALPTDRAATVRELLADVRAAQVATAGDGDLAVVGRVVAAQPRVRQFAVGEVAARQGTGGANYINPLPILRHARSLQGEPTVPPLSREYLATGNHWAPRFRALAEADLVADVAATVAPRREAIRGAVAAVRAALIDAGLPTGDLRAGVAAYLEQFGALLRVQEQEYPMRNDRLAELRPAFGRRTGEWAAALAGAADAADAADPTALLVAPVRGAMQASDAITVAHDFIQALATSVAEHERALHEDGDPLELLGDIRAALSAIAGGSDEDVSFVEEAVGVTGGDA